MTNLKPCPFCGNRNVFVGTIEQVQGAAQYDSTHYNDTHFKAVCDYINGGCGAATGGQYDNASDAAKAWNTRKE